MKYLHIREVGPTIEN